MSEHTPGPWEYDPDNGEISGCRGSIAMVLLVEDFPCLDAENDDLEAIEEGITADARLISASPDLLEAAIEFIAWIDSGKKGFPSEEKLHKAADGAIKAIAKVKGTEK